MQVERFDGDKERTVLASLIWDDTVLASAVPIIEKDGYLMVSDLSNAILMWVVKYYNKYNKAPKDDVRFSPAEIAGEDKEYFDTLADVVEALVPPSSENSEWLLDTVIKHFDGVHLKKLVTTLQSKLVLDDTDGCYEALNSFDRIRSRLSLGIAPIEDSEVAKAAYNDNTTTSLLDFDRDIDAKMFFGDTFSRSSFVVINAAEKAGKCIAGSQKVLCADGVERTIQSLVEQKQEIDVVTVNFASMRPIIAPIANWYCNGEKTCYRIVTETGKELICTKDHLLYSQTVGWKKTVDFNIGEQILVGDSQRLQWERVSEVKYYGEEFVYDIEIPNEHNFVVNGFVAHNSSLLLELSLMAVHQGKKVAYFEAGDMSQAQICRRIYQRLSGHPRRMGTVQKPKHFNVIDDDYGSDVKIDIDFKKLYFEEDMNLDIALMGCKEWQDRGVGRGLKLSNHPQDLTVPMMISLLDEWERKEGFIPDFVVVDYADIINSVSKNREYRHQINDTFARLRGLSLDRRCCLLTATQANAHSWDSNTMTREHLAEDKRKAAHPTAILGLNSTTKEREQQVAKLNFLVRRDDVCNEYECLYLAQCLPLCMPMVKTCFPAYRKRTQQAQNAKKYEDREAEEAEASAAVVGGFGLENFGSEEF